MNAFLCLWFPRWPLERLWAAQPELRNRRILLYEQTPQRSLQIVATTDPAIHPGMPLAEAIAVPSAERQAQNTVVKNRKTSDASCSAHGAPHTAPPVMLAHDPWADRQALIELAEHCDRYSPLVGIEDVPRPSCLFLKVDSNAKCGERPSAELSQFTIRAAVADTIGAAWGLARYGDHAPDTSRSAFCALRSDTPRSLAALPLAALRLPDETLMLLARLGLHRVGQVEALPRAALASRFGSPLLLRLDQMFGRAQETLQTPRVAATFAAEQTFETPLEHRETVEAVCRKLVREVAAPLAARQEGAVQWECRFDCPPGDPVRLAIGLFRPSAAAEHLWQLLRLRLESLRLPAPVAAVRLEVLASAPLVWQQQTLFETDPRQNAARQTALLIDRLSNRLGRQAVVRSVPVSDAQPEHAAMGIPLTGILAAREMNREAKARNRKMPPRRAIAAGVWRGDERPLLLKTQPLVLSALEAGSGAPRRFRIAGQDCQVARVWGPERIETGWWRSGLVRRDYYRVETTTGSHYWIFRDLRSRRWYLHGEFA